MGSLAAAEGPLSAAEFDVSYLEAAKSGLAEVCRPLAVCWSTRFEHVAPVRQFPSYVGQSNFPGSWWVSCMDVLVEFESWLERDQVMMLDYSPQVNAFSSQPFWLSWRARDGRRRRHAPDFFARLQDGTGVVIDVRADDRIEPKDAEAFEATATACDLVGWRYRRVGAVDLVVRANLAWLAGYRHPRCRDERYVGPLLEVFAVPGPLLLRARVVGDPLAVLPTLFHLIWLGLLTTDLKAAPLSGGTLIARAAARGGCE